MKFKLYFILPFIALISYSCKKKPLDEPAPQEEIIVEEAKLDETVSAVIPHIYIETAGAADVVSKDNYITGTVRIDGNGVNTDLAISTMNIKGRGNSTWNKPKKPYRIKLDAAASVLGLQSAKDWVLLANWQDYTFMTNAVAMKIGKQLGMPYTNTIIPVDVTFNGKYAGSYTLTEQIEVKDGRVNIGKEGVLLEMDTNYDEDWKFISTGYSLPISLKAPDIETETQFNSIKQEFLDFEDLVKRTDFPNNNYGNYIDKQQLVNYLIVYTLTGNLEIKHPKSVYMHKAKGGKYTMGPIWDFDWGFGLDDETRRYFTYPVDNPLFRLGDTNKGIVFFSRFLNDPEVKNLYKSTWDNYKNTKLDELLNYTEQYAASIRVSQTKDLERWKPNRTNYETEWVPLASNFPEIKKN
ncbi:MAG: spore coat protein CotH, partial [Pedobacter sp.]